MDEQTATALVRKAQATNAERSRIERKAGFAEVEDCDFPLQARTVIEALWCALRTDDENALAEGLCMLVAMEHQLRGGRGKPYEPWLTEKRHL